MATFTPLTQADNLRLGELTDPLMKCPCETPTGYDVAPLSHILLPPGTKIQIYVNEDPNDPNSDCWMEEVRLSEDSNGISAILVDPASVMNYSKAKDL